MALLRLIVGRYLLGLRRRTHVAAVSAITFSTMALGAAALVVTLALLEGFQSTIRQELLASPVHAELRPIRGSVLPEGPWLAELAAHHPDLETREVRRGPVWCLSEDGAVPARLEIGERGGQVEIDRVLAARLGVGAGSTLGIVSTVRVLTPMGPMPRRREVRVDRVVTDRPNQENAWLRVPPDLGLGLLPARAQRVVELRARDASAAWTVADRVRGELPPGVEAVSFRDLNRPLLAALELERVMIGLGVALVIVVAALNLLCNLALLAAEKRSDVAVLAAMGLEPGRIRTLFLALGVGVGALGGAVGTALGAVAAVVLDRGQLLPLPRGVFIVSHVPFRVTPAAVAVVLAVAATAAVLASLPPALAAARRSVLQGLRYE